MASEMTILTEVTQLQKLSKLIYYQEAEAIKKVKFNSEPERAKYLQDSKSNYETVLALLKSSAETMTKYESDTVRAPIAKDIFMYVIYSSNSALQTLRNYSSRKKYLEKISDHVNSDLIGNLDTLDVTNAEEVEKLANESKQSKDAMLQFITKFRSKLAIEFSQSLKMQGIKFDELLQRYQAKLHIKGTFKSLDDELKFKVYNEVLEAAGIGGIEVEVVDAVFGAAGKGVMIFAVCMTVWDIYSSAHPIQTAIHDVVVGAATMGGAYLGDLIGTAIAADLLIGIEASAFFVAMVGLVSGFIGACIVGAVAGLLIDSIIESGGTNSFDEYVKHRVHVIATPDGEALARQIVHGQHSHISNVDE